jgi:large subunit ribosomal protein L21
MYAIVKTGGKQYRVEQGEVLEVEKLEGEAGTSVELTEVLMVQDESGAKWGQPTVEGAKVVAKIVAQKRGPKVSGIVFKPKKSIRRRYGHRQSITALEIESIVA